MTELVQIVVMRIGVALLAALAVVLTLVGLVYAGHCAGRQLSTFALVMMLLIAIVATVMAQKGGRGTGDPPVDGGAMGASRPTVGVTLIGDELTNTLHFSSIDVHTNGTATLTVAWPTSLLPAAATLDLFAATSIVDSVWVWQCGHQVAAGDTNWIVTVALPEASPGTNAPSAFFYVSNRETCADTMDDFDGDGLPDAYELAHGTNPYVADYSSALKLTVGPGGSFSDIQSALAASADYSIIELDPSARHEITDSLGVRLPQHPVMLTASNSYAVVRAAGMAAFMLATNTTAQTMFKNLYLLLDAKNSFQVGFWCGGNLPWDGNPAAATFDNVYVRMPNPGVQYRGWLFYRHCADMATIRNCTVNAAGATWTIGIDAYGSPPLAVDRCSFVNFPPDTALNTGCGALLRTSGASDEGAEVTISRSLFDESFTNAWPLARFDMTNSYSVTISDCLSPRALPLEYLPDISTNITVTNAMLTWSGVPYSGSPSVALGIGSLMPVANDPLADTDGDGLCDYEEAYDLGTDPFNADTDNDDVPDGTEVDDGTDPSNPHSFKQRLTVSVTNTASLAHAVYTAWGYSEDGWESNGLAAFPQGCGDTVYTNASSQGAMYIKTFCDLNGNGEYDAAYDILLVRPIPSGGAAQVRFVFGDVDGDAVSDAQERQEGTDPYDANNFRFVATITFTDKDVGEGLTNHVALSEMAGIWSNDWRMACFTDELHTLTIDTNLTVGVLHVMCLRDFNGDGEYGSADDVLYDWTLGKSDNGRTVYFAIGDYDYDNVLDSMELAEGTSPLRNANYCFNLSVTFSGIFATTNLLSAEVFFGTNRIDGPVVMSSRTWNCDIGHLVASNSESVVVYFWDDLDSDGERGESEKALTNRFFVTGHDMVVTNRLEYGVFDADGDGMLDCWELQNGLSPNNAGDAVQDADNDGFINLHEYWAGTDPNDPAEDGSGTALYALIHDIDDRIAVAAAPGISNPQYLNYSHYQLPATLMVNLGAWSYGIDFSCTSIWNDSFDYQYGDPATLLSPQHVILAKHLISPIGRSYTFCDTNGFRAVRTLVATQGVASTDITIGLLDNSLPESFTPAKLLPDGYERYAGTGAFIPVLHMDQDRHSFVQELPPMPRYEKRFVEILCNRGSTANRLEYYESVIGKDSGSPCFMIIDGQKILIYAVQGHQKGNFLASKGYHTFLFKSEIQQLMDSMSDEMSYPRYNLQSFDFSGYLQLENQ